MLASKTHIASQTSRRASGRYDHRVGPRPQYHFQSICRARRCRHPLAGRAWPF